MTAGVKTSIRVVGGQNQVPEMFCFIFCIEMYNVTASTAVDRLFARIAELFNLPVTCVVVYFNNFFFFNVF